MITCNTLNLIVDNDKRLSENQGEIIQPMLVAHVQNNKHHAGDEEDDQKGTQRAQTALQVLSKSKTRLKRGCLNKIIIMRALRFFVFLLH